MVTTPGSSPACARSQKPGGLEHRVALLASSVSVLGKMPKHPKNFRHDGAETTKLAFREARISEALSSGNRSR